MKTCTYHCRTCNRHFHSLHSFDTHRAFSDPGVEDWARRVCLDPEHDVERLQKRDGSPMIVAWTRNGVCRIEAGGVQTGVTIWQNEGADRMRDRFATRGAWEARKGDASLDEGDTLDPSSEALRMPLGPSR